MGTDGVWEGREGEGGEAAKQARSTNERRSEVVSELRSARLRRYLSSALKISESGY